MTGGIGSSIQRTQGLLLAVRHIFRERKLDRIGSSELAQLVGPMTPRRLADFLRPLGVRPYHGDQFRAYRAKDVEAACARLLRADHAGEQVEPQDLDSQSCLLETATAQPPQEPLKEELRPCSICGGRRFWRRLDGQILCATCHPALDALVIAGFLNLPDANQ